MLCTEVLQQSPETLLVRVADAGPFQLSPEIVLNHDGHKCVPVSVEALDWATDVAEICVPDALNRSSRAAISASWMATRSVLAGEYDLPFIMRRWLAKAGVGL